MFYERILAKDSSQRGLIGKLWELRRFLATDQRDKLYTLLGFAKDGESFNKYISYTPDETPVKVFARFVSLLA